MTDNTPEFLRRHIGLSRADETAMLAEIGQHSMTDLLDAAMPPAIRTPDLPDVPFAASEAQVLDELSRIAAKNTVRTSMIGRGYYDTYTPSVITRNVLENPGWYTAYTPYQPEISQGRLEALLNFQTMISDLTGLDVTGASMLDEGTAVAEAMLLARRVVKAKDRTVFLVDADTLPQTKSILTTRAKAVGVDLVEFDVTEEPSGVQEAFGLLLSYPQASGRVPQRAQLEAWTGAAAEAGAQVAVAADLLALTQLTEPAAWGADMVAGTTQRFGVPMGFGGPHAGYLAVRQGLYRQLPGRLVGVSKDVDGQPGLRLALQTREQHIRREKATSNICTAQVLLAVMAAMYAVYHGPHGLREIGARVHDRATDLASRLDQGGIAVVHQSFFDTVQIRVPGRADEVLAAALERNITLWREDADTVAIACDEATTPEIVEQVVAAATQVAGDGDGPAGNAASGDGGGNQGFAVDSALGRTTEFCTHPVFSSYHSETAMMRYLRRLCDKDYALDQGMIPLGSCTMKLNAATEMAAITWPGFARIHPFAPTDDVAGYTELIGELNTWLAQLTGYAQVSMQPNAGSQGELAGLLAIRSYHRANGDSQRTICLVPASAHGTNAASAVLAGLQVKTVASADNGDIDLDDLRRVLAENEGRIAGIMVTYPSTHGVYEPGITELCELVHEAGGQVYIDGANFNALAGYSGLGSIGGDVSHLNLHKTFCIPHGGGGPGVGPVAVAEHLVPFLPGHPMAPELGSGLAISAAPYGSPSILPISWAYIRLMGSTGLRAATEAAVLSANYIATRLHDYFPVLYRGANGLVAHECILDLRPLTATSGITVEDVAKRLIDYGFHAPTMAFPVAGTLMVEPTESEDLGELERFIDTMIAIHDEMQQVASGQWPADDNPLVNAPHTAASVLGDWERPYTREQAAHPLPQVAADKYWPPVRRVDGAYGDRNLVAVWPAVEADQKA